MPQVSGRFGPYPVSVTLDGAGNGQVSFQAVGNNVRLTNGYVSVSTRTLQAVCTAYKQLVGAGYAVSSTNSGSTGATFRGPFDLMDGESLIVRWTGGDPGAVATATFTGIQIPFDQIGPSQIDWEDPIAAGDGSLIYPALKSPNFVTTVSGWIIRRDGTFELAGGIFRGEIFIVSPSGTSIHAFADSNFAEIDFQPPPDANPANTWGPGRIFSASSGSQPRVAIQGPPITAPSSVSAGFLTLAADLGALKSYAALSATLLDLGNQTGGGITTLLSATSKINGALTVLGAITWGLSAVTVEAKDSGVTTGTTTSTTFTNTLTTAGIRGVAFVVAPSGKATISGSAGGANSTIAIFTLLSVEVRTGGTPGSGTIILASDENSASQFQSAVAASFGQHCIADVLVSGMTAGNTVNASLTYRVTANTGSYNRRRISVTPVI